MARELNDRMEFDHVIRVRSDRSVVDADEVRAPELYDGQVSTPWTLLRGFSGQYGGSAGWNMHPSEFIGGGMERHILDHPGFYVALVSERLPDDEDGESESDGWAVAYWDGR